MLDRFGHAMRDYLEFKTQFAGFCESTKKRLDGNQHLPGVSFSGSDDGTSATLCSFDRTFILRFYLVVLSSMRAGSDEQHVGMFGVYLPPSGAGEETLLWHTFFDRLGNVRDKLDTPSASCNLQDCDFFAKLLRAFTEPCSSRPIDKFMMRTS